MGAHLNGVQAAAIHVLAVVGQLVTVQLMALLGVHWQPSLVQPHFS